MHELEDELEVCACAVHIDYFLMWPVIFLYQSGEESFSSKDTIQNE